MSDTGDRVTAAVTALVTAALADWDELGATALTDLATDPALHAAVTIRLAHHLADDVRRVAELIDRDPHDVMAEVAVAWHADPDPNWTSR